MRFGDVSGSWEREGCGPFHIYEGEFAFVMGSTLEPRGQLPPRLTSDPSRVPVMARA